MLVDKLRINVKSGRGGDGRVAFLPSGKPSGGDGGTGGDVYIEGTSNLYDLKSLKQNRTYIATNGELGKTSNKQGKNGDDVTIKVPITTVVQDLEGKEIVRIEKHGQKIKLLEGGRGGLGNYYFRAGQVRTLKMFTPGKPSQELQLILELRLKADVLFLGFPNAGKSSMLNMLTNASVEVGAYPFTTLQPHLGVAGRVVLMDFPGLIEGSHEGKGLGTKHFRHTENIKLVAHFISLENEDVNDAYQKMRNELENIDERFKDTEEIIVLTKCDMFDDAYIDAKIEELKHLEKQIIVTSAFQRELVQEIIEVFEDAIV